MKKKLIIILLDILLVACVIFSQPIIFFLSMMIPECPALSVGILCPACGGTRCVYYFFSGDFSTAFSMNGLIFLTILYAFAVLVLWNLSWFFEVRFATKVLKRLLDYRVFFGWGIGMGLFFLIRNLI